MWHIILNPVAGSGLALRSMALIEAQLQKLGEKYHIHQTRAPLDATRIAQTLAGEGAEKIMCVGGDGTLFEVANGIRGTGTALALIPAGTGNDFCRSLNIPKDALGALALAQKASPKRVDLGLMGERAFLNVAGMGFDVQVVQRMNKYRFLGHGQLPYLMAVFETMLRFRPIDVSLEIDGLLKKARVLLIAIANGKFIGGGMKVAPEADPWDGLLDVVMIHNVPRWRMPFLLPKFIKGQTEHIPEIVRCRAKEVRLMGQTHYYNVDGEVLEMKDASFSVSHGGMAVLVLCK